MPATVDSTRFGTLTPSDTDLIEFPDGLIGLDGKRWVLVETDAASPFRWLQCAEDPALALPVTDPWRFFSDYELEVSDEDTAAAGIPEDAAHEVRVLVTVRATPEEATVNLKAPILVYRGRGRQVISQTPDTPMRARLDMSRARQG